ncbi:MAG TPA: flagellar biosynthetic protein FliO [Nitrospirota bacterium]|nr:flagellar biosynthetic protein FliO [Nitrospirota bacterium]
MIDLYLHMGIALVVVGGLLALLSYVLRKRQSADGMMKIVGYQSLGPKKGIAMVKVGPEVLLVGVTATDVKLLKSLNRPGEPAEPREARPPAAPQAVSAAAPGNLQKLRAIKNTLKDNAYAAQ